MQLSVTSMFVGVVFVSLSLIVSTSRFDRTTATHANRFVIKWEPEYVPVPGAGLQGVALLQWDPSNFVATRLSVILKLRNLSFLR